MKKKAFLLVLLLGLFSISGFSFACGGSASGKHIGPVLSMDNNKGTFTIRDAETNQPITFMANPDVMSNVKNANGRLMVNYEKNDKGSLEALAVSF